MIKTIILDFDGTMGDSKALIVKTMQETMAQLQLDVKDADTCAATIGLPLSKSFEVMYGMNSEQADKCANTYRKIFMANKGSMVVHPFPHVISTVKLLNHYGITIALASSRSRASLEEYVKLYSIESCISCIVAADDVVHAKPAPDMVLKILKETHSKPEETLVVGDMSYDIDMGHAAHTTTCGVTYGNGTRKELQEADFLVDDFKDIACLTACMLSHNDNNVQPQEASSLHKAGQQDA